LPRKKRRERKRRKNRRLLALVVLIVTVGAAGALILAGFNPFNVGRSISTVVVIMPAGSAENLRLSFTPSLIKIVIGVNNTVIWENEDSEWHTAHSNIPEFDSKMIPPGASFTHTFQRAGSYPYHCDPHPWMTGLIIVAGSNPLFVQQITQLGISLRVMARFLVQSSEVIDQ
jgi:plastocyanin